MSSPFSPLTPEQLATAHAPQVHNVAPARKPRLKRYPCSSILILSAHATRLRLRADQATEKVVAAQRNKNAMKAAVRAQLALIIETIFANLAMVALIEGPNPAWVSR